MNAMGGEKIKSPLQPEIEILQQKFETAED